MKRTKSGSVGSFYLLTFLLILTTNKTILAQNDILWYEYPAKYWNSQALHLGNGFMGASFFGGVEEEKIALTEESIWTGGPFRGDWEEIGINPKANIYLDTIREAIVRGDVELADSLTQKYYLGQNKRFGTFSSIGDLKIKMLNHGMLHSNYKRKLDLAKSIGSVSYELDGVNYSREYFCSYPKNVLVMKLKADQSKKVGFALYMDVIQKEYEVEITENEYIVTGFVDGGEHQFQVRINMIPFGGDLLGQGNLMGLTQPYWGVQNADSVIIIINTSTDYKQEFPHYKGEKPAIKTNRLIKNATNAGYEALKQEHINDYTELYDRVSLNLNSNESLTSLPTNERYARFQSGEQDIGLKELAFNLGRYLIISSSRPGTLPANLQGKWNTFYFAPWAGNYQANINIQEIYWSCGPTNLLECQVPYIDWVDDLVRPGREVAKKVYGTNGWISHTTGNIWGHAAPSGGLVWGTYPLASVWHCQHLWEQFTFSQDVNYLKETAYPIIKEAAIFWLENLIEYKEGLIVAPSVSAEHGSTKYYENNPSKKVAYNIPGAYQDAQMIRDLFNMSIEAAEILKIDKTFITQVKAKKKKLLPHKIGQYNQLQEWYKDIDSKDDHHRHIAHLYAVCPDNDIHPLTTPTLAEAAKVSLNMRGDDRDMDFEIAAGGNWSRCWRIWCWARLMDGNRANKIFDEMLREQGFENLLTHQHAEYSMGRPDLFRETDNMYLHFQLDASASTPGFMAEMLLQSHLGEIILLPALPNEWKSGNVKGLKARGDYTVDIEWENGELVNASITTPNKKVPTIRVKDKIVNTKDERIRIKNK